MIISALGVGAQRRGQNSPERSFRVVGLCLGLVRARFFLSFSTRRVGGTAPICTRAIAFTAVTARNGFGFFFFATQRV